MYKHIEGHEGVHIELFPFLSFLLGKSVGFFHFFIFILFLIPSLALSQTYFHLCQTWKK